MGNVRGKLNRLLSIWSNPFLLPTLMIAALVVPPSAPRALAKLVPSGECAEQKFEGSRFTVCRLDTRRHDFRLALDARDGWPLHHLPALAHDLGKNRSRARFAMNAGMYDRAGKPLGLYVENGKERRGLNQAQGSGNFFLHPGGVFSVDIDRTVRAETLESYTRRKAKPQWATQSGPMLLIDGALHPAIQQDGRSRYYRNGVGVMNNHSAAFVISEDRVSLGKFARLFRDQLKCSNALFLDGAVSSLWYPASGRMDSNFALGPMLLVSDQTQ
jgi:uncharacterized protein YigE (DUF2233 family)